MPTSTVPSLGDTVAPHGISWWWLALSVAIVASVALFCASQYRHRRKSLDAWLVKSRALRRRLFVGISILEIVVFATFLAAADIPGLHPSWQLTTVRMVSFTVLACVVAAYVLIRTLLLFHDDQWEVRISELKQLWALAEDQREEAIFIGDWYSLLNAAFLTRVKQLHADIGKTLKDIRSPGVALVEDAISPARSRCQIVHLVYEVFREITPHIGSQLRVALYQTNQEARRLEYVYSWDGSQIDCVESPRVNSDEFSLSNVGRCLAVNCAVLGKLRVVEDAEQAHGDVNFPFNFFGNAQHSRIGSIIAIPLPQHQPTARYVITVDSPDKGRFATGLDRLYGLLADNLDHRLRLLDALGTLFRTASKTTEE